MLRKICLTGPMSGIQIRLQYKFIFYFSTTTYVVGSQWDGSFEHPTQILELMGKSNNFPKQLS